jgi:hypothetical protein
MSVFSVNRGPVNVIALLATVLLANGTETLSSAGKTSGITNETRRSTAEVASSSGIHAGFIRDEFDLTLEPGHRLEAAGPLYYDEHAGARRTWAFPPLLSYTRDPSLELVEFNFVFPLLTYDRYGKQYRWQLGQLLSFAGGPTQLEEERHRTTLFPIYFRQRSSLPDQNYTAVIPFYGHLQHRLFHDEIFFVMFPFYAETRKGSMVTDNYVYPFFHLRHGPGLEGWQFWPIVGHEHKDVTTRTNGFGDIETVPGHDSRFYGWFLYFNTTAGIGTTNTVQEKGSIPFFSMYRSPMRDSTTVLWPLFSHIDDRERKYREWQAPWFLVEYARGEGKTTTRIWPFFSRSHNANLESDFYLWPVYKYNRVHADELERERTRIAFFLYSDTVEKNSQTHKMRRWVNLLPFFTWRKEWNGNTRLQVLAPLEPFLPGSHKIERDYSPIWSIWRAENNAETHAASQSLLWNLYRREVTPDLKRISALFGLYQHQSDATGKRVRLFYIPVKGK